MEVVFDITPEELPIFMAEASEQLQILDEGLVSLERGDNDLDLIQALFRAAHTLKGSAGMIGHLRMVSLTHTLETALDGLRKRTLAVTPDFIDACLVSVDALRLLTDEVACGESSSASVEEFVTVLEKFTKAAAQDTHSPAKEKISANTPVLRAGTVRVQAFITPDSIASAARAFQVMLAMQGLGEIVQMTPSQAQIETAAPVEAIVVELIPAPALAQNPHPAIRKALEQIAELSSYEISGDQEDTPATAIEAAKPAARAPEIRKTASGDTATHRLGLTLIENGVITNEQLQQALALQNNTTGPKMLLGQALVKLGAVTQDVLDQVIQDLNVQKGEAAPGESIAQESGRHRLVEKTIRTSVERLDNLMNLVGELLTDRNRLFMIRHELEARYRGIDTVEAISETITHVGRITDQLQAEVMGIRMLPISNVFNKFPRLVRDLSRKAGKQVELVMHGEDTELDRSVIEVISDPLIHILRNAVDHGLETPEERLAAGKPERGIIVLSARHEQGRIIITVEDNGRGINLERVRQKAVEKGILTQNEADSLTNEETIDLIFLSGLSTAKVISDVSGRGVGMDIVRNNIERLNGNIQVDTWTGRGSQFQITLPLTLAIVPTLLVRVSTCTYAIPLVTVNETLRVPVREIRSVNGKPVIVLRDQVLPVSRLTEVFNLEPAGNGKSFKQYEYVVVVQAGKTRLGLIVDSLIGEQEVVVKSLSSVIGDVSGISNAAILGDGKVALIIDVQGILKIAAQQIANRREGQYPVQRQRLSGTTQENQYAKIEAAN